MHPRNIYRKKRNFDELGVEFPEFAKYLKHFPNGNVTIDFTDSHAVRCLTQCLLQKDFSLDVNIPPDRLIPAVPQRLNYVLWVEDLIELTGKQNDAVRGFDVGVGSCCIFPLLICQKNPSYFMHGVEVDTKSYSAAVDNVQRNGLTSRITLVLSDDWVSVITSCSQQFMFSMCNPPFFDKEEQHDDEDMDGDNDLNVDKQTESEGSTTKTRKKSAANVSTATESIAVGGEEAFVLKMIHDSFLIKNQVKIFTVMLGRKASLMHLKKHLRNFQSENEDLSFTWTEFCQGRTMRWGLGWSFLVNLDKSKDVCSRVKKTCKTYTLDPIPYKQGMFYSVEGLTDMLLTWIIQDLEIKTYRLTRLTKQSSEIIISSQVNTWSNQRRKRRQKKQQEQQTTHEESSSTGSLSPAVSCKRKDRDDEDIIDDSFNSSIDSDQHHDDEPLMKRLREEVSKSSVLEQRVQDGIQYLLHASISLKKEGKGIYLRMQTQEGSLNPETTYQLFQFFKNKFTCV